MAFGHPETHSFTPADDTCSLCGLPSNAPRHRGDFTNADDSFAPGRPVGYATIGEPPTAEEFEQLIEISDEFEFGSFTIYALVPVDDPTLTDNWRYTLGALAAICWDLTAVATLLLKEHR